MSPYESILDLSELWIQHVERHNDIHVWARPSQRPSCIHCQHKEVRIKATHRRTSERRRISIFEWIVAYWSFKA